MDFRPLQHIQGSKVDLTQAFQACYAPPSGFGYPLDGFFPSNPGRLYFAPAALLGFALRSFLLSKGVRHVSVRTHPPTVSPFGATSAETEGPARKAAVPGLLPFQESLATVCVFRATITGCSLGFIPSRVSQHRPQSGFRPISSRALRNRPCYRPTPCASEYLSTRA